MDELTIEPLEVLRMMQAGETFLLLDARLGRPIERTQQTQYRAERTESAAPRFYHKELGREQSRKK